MKIAIVHDYIKEYGGAERVLEALHELYPDAPVYTSVFLPTFLGPHRERFEGWDIRTSWAQFLPFVDKLISPLRLISPLLFRSFDFSKYDVVIVSATGAYAPNSIKLKSQNSKVKITTQNSKVGNTNYPLHICYCHTPPHYLYGYMTARDWKKNWVMRAIGEVGNHFLRLVDYKSSQNVDFFIANSEEVASRIKKFYRRESTVIYPPVDINSNLKSQNSKLQLKIQKLGDDKKGYYLTGGRLARAKGVDIILEAFRKNKKPLKVFGRGFGDFNEISNSKYQISNIQYVGEVSDEEKFRLMANAKAFVFASFDEDFGITPVEAMGMGTPVIAYKSGGVKETVVHEKTGLLYDQNNPQTLIKAIEQFEKLKISREDCIKQAEKFSQQRFKERIKAFIEQKQ